MIALLEGLTFVRFDDDVANCLYITVMQVWQGVGRGASALFLCGKIGAVVLRCPKLKVTMKTLMMLIADYASVEQQTGKLNILGVFDRIYAEGFPALHRRLYIAAKFEKGMSDTSGPYRLSAALANEDGVEVVRIEGSFSMGEGSYANPPQHSLVFELNSLKFECPGDYRLHILVNDGELVDESTILQLIQVAS